jgi:hypothetical protein
LASQVAIQKFVDFAGPAPHAAEDLAAAIAGLLINPRIAEGLGTNGFVTPSPCTEAPT